MENRTDLKIKTNSNENEKKTTIWIIKNEEIIEIPSFKLAEYLNKGWKIYEIKNKHFETAREICAPIEKIGKKCYVVGGGIRDVLLGRDVHDVDLTTDARPEEVMNLFKNEGRKVIPTGIKFGTVTVLDGEPVEITTFRKEGKYKGHHPKNVEYITDVKEDLSRRDFTINAIAYDPIKKQIVDPFNGIKDLKAKIIRTVGKPEERFKEDPLRMLRACRFSSKLDFEIEPRTRKALKEYSDMITYISPERIRDEIMKTMESKKPSKGIDCMIRSGLLTHLIPEFIDLMNCKYKSKYHRYTPYKHTLKMIDIISRNDPELRFVALFHDIGKPYSVSIDENGNVHFYDHEKISAEIFNDVCRRLKISNQLRIWGSRLIEHHLIPYSKTWTDKAIRKFINKVGIDIIDDLLDLKEADIKAGIKIKNFVPELRARINKLLSSSTTLSTFSLKDLAVTGNDVMKELNILPSPKVGEILDILFEHVLEHPEDNTREKLIEIMKNLKKNNFI